MNEEPDEKHVRQLPPFAAEWMTQWRNAARELPKIRAQELRELSDRDTFELLHQHDIPPEDAYSNGMVKQQSWFSRLRILQLLKEKSP